MFGVSGADDCDAAGNGDCCFCNRDCCGGGGGVPWDALSLPFSDESLVCRDPVAGVVVDADDATVVDADDATGNVPPSLARSCCFPCSRSQTRSRRDISPIQAPLASPMRSSWAVGAVDAAVK